MDKRKLKIAYLKALQRGDKDQAASIKKEIEGKVVVVNDFGDMLKVVDWIGDDPERDFIINENSSFSQFLKTLENKSNHKNQI